MNRKLWPLKKSLLYMAYPHSMAAWQACRHALCHVLAVFRLMEIKIETRSFDSLSHGNMLAGVAV